jgi:23S rRNA (uracil1939-C5)-methyltransferase
MRIEPGSTITLDIEKPTAGGRMLARHEGRVILVSAAIPGERVHARVERIAKGVVYADTADVVTASPDRRGIAADWRCGGNVLAHIAYPRQLQLKAEIVHDAFARIARLPLPAPPEVIGSPEHGYRMRARLHARDGRLGFFREGSHDLCDAVTTGQLLPATHEWIAAAEETLRRERLTGLAGIELAENIPGDQRACHLELHAGVDATRFAPLAPALTGLSAERTDRPGITVLAGSTTLRDVLHLGGDDQEPTVRLGRDVRAFFQGNRFLLQRLVHHVADLVQPGPVLDLYAGVGLFGLSCAATGAGPVTLVEGDLISGADLQRNAETFGGDLHVERRSVEAFLRSAPFPPNSTVIVDPPRTGMTRDAVHGIIRLEPARVIYVSCDVATLARDARTLVDGGYELRELSAMDLFPNTAHVETIAVFVRR